MRPRALAIAIAMVFCLPIAAVGALFIYGSFGAADRDAEVARTGTRTTGTITGKWRTLANSGGNTLATRSTFPTYTTEYRFTLPDGRSLTARSADSVLWERIKVGDHIAVRYDAADPRTNFPDGYGFSRAMAKGLAAMGAFAQLPLVVILAWFLRSRLRGSGAA